jgi:propanol-preferring alcohol dehydrogenase
VEEVGAGVESVSPGDHVVLSWLPACGRCFYCVDGRPNLCAESAPAVLAGTMLDGTTRLALEGETVYRMATVGALAEHVLVPAYAALPLAPDVSVEGAAVLGCAALTGVGAVLHAARVPPGASALVIGAGGLGQMAVQLVKLLTPAKAIVVDISPEKRQAALDLGADVAIDATAADATEQIREATGGEGAAAVLDLVGTDETLALAAASVGRQSTLVLVGLAGGSVPFGFFTWPPEVVVTSSNWGSRNELAEVVALAQDGLIQVRVESSPLEQINEVFTRLEQGQVNGRAVLVPGMNGGKERT